MTGRQVYIIIIYMFVVESETGVVREDTKHFPSCIAFSGIFCTDGHVG